MTAFQTFRGYMGTGLILIWYLAMVVFLFVTEKRKDRRILLIYVPFLVLLLFFNPLFDKLFQRFLGKEIYFRILWLLPVTVTLCYGIVRVCAALRGKKQWIFAGIAAAFIVVSGTCVYSSPLFSKAENADHVPQEVAEICDMINLPGVNVMAAFPVEMIYYVRQYSPFVCMPYGREIMLNGFSELEYCMHYSKIDVERLSALAKEQRCHYVIFEEEKELIGNMEDYDYVLWGQVGKYLVYRDMSIPTYSPAE